MLKKKKGRKGTTSFPAPENKTKNHNTIDRRIGRGERERLRVGEIETEIEREREIETEIERDIDTEKEGDGLRICE